MVDESQLRDAQKRLSAVYDPELLRAAGHRLADLLADQIARAESAEGAVLPWVEPAENVRRAAAMLAAGEVVQRDRSVGQRFVEIVETMLAGGLNLQHPHYIGHQVAASVPLAGWFDAVGAVTNQAMAIYDMGPWGTAAEWAMVARLGQEVGWRPGSFGGMVTHGGSLANLTGLLTARNVVLSGSWRQGLAGHETPPVIVVHRDAHYSVSRAAGILGLGTAQVLRAELDDRRRMDPGRLEDQLTQLRDKQQPVAAVVSCACSTPIGAFDPLEAIADVCQRLGVWMHVDAAHGGSACLSPRYRGLVAGLERADSVVWDAHKMLFVPALCAFVFYRNAEHRFAAFQQDAPYLFDPAAPGLAEYDSALRTVECTKRSAVFGLWGLWSLYGKQLFTDLVEVTFARGRLLFEMLSASGDFEALHEPQCNIVVFRHLPPGLRKAPAEIINRYQLELRRRLIESGCFYIVSTKLDGQAALRVTIINPLTTCDHLQELLATLREKGRKLERELVG